VQLTAVLDTIPGFRAALDVARADGHSIGFVPTMGYLHDGHVSLMRTAVAECDVVAASIFVNPLQFGAGEDLDAYPRDLDRDLALCSDAGVQWVFAPSVDEMYPDGTPMATAVSVAGVSAPMEGASRPTHFGGVATVVAKLFAIAGPCRAYFGEKDWQQLAVIRRMATDLSFPVDVVGCPTVREPDGLALSSRNVYLTPAERAAAPALHRALQAGIDAIAGGERRPAAVQAAMRAVLADVPEAVIDYLEVVDAATLAGVDPLSGTLRLLGAARFGKARLIDNVGATV
jgi:pantoate--beta-alanine ligase